MANVIMKRTILEGKRGEEKSVRGMILQQSIKARQGRCQCITLEKR